MIASAENTERITWLVPELLLGDAPGQPRKGMSETMANYLISQWPQARHEVVLVNVKRSWVMIEAGEHACHLAMLHTPERESKAYFANTHLLPPVQLIVRKDRLAQVPRNAAGEADLRQLLRNDVLRGALVADRSYGSAIDAELSARPYRSVTRYAPSDFGGRMLNMLVAGRADYSIDFDFMRLLQRQQQAPAGAAAALVSLPIRGASDPLTSGVACPRNEWGREVVRRVDQIFSTPAGVAALKRNEQLWLTKETQARYGARIDAFYRQRLKAAGFHGGTKDLD